MHALTSPADVRIARAPRARAVRRASTVLATARSGPEPKGSKPIDHPAFLATKTALAGGIAALSVSLAASPALAFGLGVTSPPPPELNSEGNSYIQGLLAKTEANKEIRKVEMESSNCLKQSRLGIGDCAGLPESELRAAIELSKARVEARMAAEAAEAATAAAEAVEAAAAEVREQGDWSETVLE